MKIKVCYVLLILFLITGCSSLANPGDQITFAPTRFYESPVPIATQTPLNISEKTLQSITTQTPEVMLPIIGPQFDFDGFPSSENIRFICPESFHQNLPENMFSGSLLLISQSIPEGFWNLENNSFQDFPSENVELNLSFDFVSPDGKWLLYRELHSDSSGIEGSWLVVQDHRSENVYMHPWLEDWDYAYWLNNSTVVVRGFNGNRILFDPFSGKTTEINIKEYPDEYYVDSYEKLTWGPRIDPGGQFLVNTNGIDYFIWNIAKKEKILVIEASTYRIDFYPPVWSPDGNTILLAVPEEHENNSFHVELFLYSLDGKYEKLTNYSELFEEGLGIANYSWSPDGKKIALFVVKRIDNNPYFFTGVYVLESGITTFYCVENNYVYPPIWSPDNKSLLVSKFDDSWISFEKHYLINLDNDTIFEFGEIEDSFPIEWMVSDD